MKKLTNMRLQCMSLQKKHATKITFDKKETNEISATIKTECVDYYVKMIKAHGDDYAHVYADKEEKLEVYLAGESIFNYIDNYHRRLDNSLIYHILAGMTENALRKDFDKGSHGFKEWNWEVFKMDDGGGAADAIEYYAASYFDKDKMTHDELIGEIGQEKYDMILKCLQRIIDTDVVDRIAAVDEYCASADKL